MEIYIWVVAKSLLYIAEVKCTTTLLVEAEKIVRFFGFVVALVILEVLRYMRRAVRFI